MWSVTRRRKQMWYSRRQKAQTPVHWHCEATLIPVWYVQWLLRQVFRLVRRPLAVIPLQRLITFAAAKDDCSRVMYKAWSMEWAVSQRLRHKREYCILNIALAFRGMHDATKPVQTVGTPFPYLRGKQYLPALLNFRMPLFSEASVLRG